ncbi:MAG: AAA family ATPase [Mariniblastus sp.]
MTDKTSLPAPPYLHAVYLREDFDLTQAGSAFEPFESQPENVELATKLEDELEESGSTSTAMMDDDEFLQSLVSPEPDLSESISKSEFEPPPTQDHPTHPVPHKQKPSVARSDRFPFSIPWVHQNFELRFPNAVTFFVGENGSGKSTLIEAIASLCGYPISGGGTNDATSRFGPEHDSELAQAMYPEFQKRHRDGYFFRAEFYAHFASLLEQRAIDPDFEGDPYGRYGGKSLHQRSHGESFLALLQNRFHSGLYLLDEPESALSPQRQLTLLAMIADRVSKGKSQFIIATHSPILMTYPGATIIDFDSESLEPVALEDTTHYHLTRGILDNPQMYWRHLLNKDDEK